MVQTVRTKSEVVDICNKFRSNGKSIGFVPTMGALHQGHLSLIKRAVDENDLVVASVFVNPTQFNNKDDLKNYPRTPEKDIEMLSGIGTGLVFIPSVEEMYPETDNRVFNFGLLGEVMEGAHRPGHFNGVAQVVSKLFDIVNPHRAYFGQKDYQQLAIIRWLVATFGYSIEIVGCPTVREADGLALSSRNTLLTPEIRSQAPLISQTIHQACSMKQGTIQQLIDWVVDTINGCSLLKVEYFEVANALTLEPVRSWSAAEHIVGCIAVQAGSVRLIDNVMLK